MGFRWNEGNLVEIRRKDEVADGELNGVEFRKGHVVWGDQVKRSL